MWKSYVEHGKPRMTILRMRIACWVPKAKITPRYVIRSLHFLLGIVWVYRRDLMWYKYSTLSFLIGSFAILRKATICFIMSVCTSVHMEHLGSHSMDFHEFWHVSIFRISVDKNVTSLTSHNCNVYFTWRPKYLFGHISLSSSSNEKCFSKSCRGNQNSHFVSNNVFSNIVTFMRQCGKLCWTRKATDEYVALAHCILVK